MAEYCANDGTRFGTLKATKKWIAKGGGRGLVAIYTVGGNTGQELTEADLAQLTSDDVHMVADGWSGFDLNKHIPGADITTAYRNSEEGTRLAYERRKGPDDKFKLGLPLGELVIGAGIGLYGAAAKKVSLETWGTNTKARTLYEQMGFELVATKEDTRPTLKPVSTVINGNVVYEEIREGKSVHLVEDIRCFYKLGNTHPLVAAAA